ncbi:PepSY domain-containing protein [Aromatoleum petrolei]|uniref:PepSY domain-containing protein n=1 Tax=Aromatoleum petrolei TaxID=76116 RepID=A0ABX1MVY8_9RHOO|nr:PepSY domain-containing protein [Aromatoleum petrolei]NMF90748.1 PepSY domain-containing protein [Aromatoleum petrolei]QTQ38419.1 PepSY domain-containing protein [Aromatoleum petrolei]
MNVRHFTLAAAALLIGTSAFADPNCTAATKDPQPAANSMRTLVDAGFKFQRAKVTKGNCYELKGTNTVGDRVEIYLNPADGTNVKTETKKL